jgi:hypothetical protein
MVSTKFTCPEYGSHSLPRLDGENMTEKSIQIEWKTLSLSSF